jgi:hypothetical protein
MTKTQKASKEQFEPIPKRGDAYTVKGYPSSPNHQIRKSDQQITGSPSE